MPAFTQAQPPTTAVTEIPGRYEPVYVIDKRTVATVSTSTNTSTVLAFLPRTESVNSSLDTPTTPITELGTNFNVGEYDDLPEAKLQLQNYDTGFTAISLITGKNAPASTTTHYGFNDLANANIDVVRQFADPNGNVFASIYSDNMVIDEFGMNLKAKSAAMEDYSLCGFNTLLVKNFVITKAYVVTSTDVTNKTINLQPLFGANEAPVALPVPGGSSPPSYWIQRGSLNFLKIDRWRSGQSWVRYPEVTVAPTVLGTTKYENLSTTLLTAITTTVSQSINVGSTAGLVVGDQVLLDTIASGVQETVTVTAVTDGTHFTAAPTHTHVISSPVVCQSLNFAATDLVAGDVFYVTYWSYGSSVSNFNTIPQTTVDTADAVAVPTRLTPFTISANNIKRGSSLDVKVMLKRDRAEGIGDTDGLWGPPDAPVVTVNFDLKVTDFTSNSVLMTGTPNGTDGGGTVLGDMLDPNYVTRLGLSGTFPLVATLNDPRNAGAVLKTYTFPTCVFKNHSLSANGKSPVTVKWQGGDKVGNFDIAVIRP